jgi:hypothetical protein
VREIPLILTALLVLTGCDDSVDPEPVAASGSTLCVADYEACVNPVFDAVLMGKTGQTTCTGSGCHDVDSGSGGAFKIFPRAQPGSTEMLANFFAAKGFANLDDPANSKLLLEPLQGVSSVAGTHTGGDIFPDTGDACYQAIIRWVSTRVDDEAGASCGVCTPADISACGY